MFFSFGRIMENSTQSKAAVQCFQKALSTVQRDFNWQEIAWRLGMVFKREGNWNEAVKVWKSILERIPDKIEIYEELAKYYEHQIKQFDKAIDVVKQALERMEVVQELRGDLPTFFWKERFAYRLERLEKKRKIAFKQNLKSEALNSKQIVNSNFQKSKQNVRDAS